MLTKDSPDGPSLVIRCAAGKTSAYVATDDVVAGGGIRLRFDDSSPSRQFWSESTDHTALFAQDPITFSRQLTHAREFFFEFTPFQKVPKIVTFEVTGLGDLLPKVSETCNWAAIDKQRQKAAAADKELRAKLLPYVHPCRTKDHEGNLLFPGQWCWTDPDDENLDESVPSGGTKEQTLREAMDWARMGLGFKSITGRK